MNVTNLTNEQILRGLYKELIGSCSYINDRNNLKTIKEAYREAVTHFGDARNSRGEFQLRNAVSVACISANEMGLDTTSIIASLLQHLPLPKETESQEFKKKFGESVYVIIQKLQFIAGIRMDKISIMTENFIQLLLSFSGEIRVILIKLADRINLMRIIDTLPAEEQKQISIETTALYLPLAHRLGLYKVKTELDDLAMKHALPEVYSSIAKKIDDSTVLQKEYFDKFIAPIRKNLLAAGFDFELKARTKSIPSIYSKMKKQGIDFDEVLDFLAMRIIIQSDPVHEKADCWKVYSLITDIYQPDISRLRDWISKPRPNGYESLHVTVDAPDNRYVEIQIRSWRMDEHAEKGLAAHWRYKEEKGGKPETDNWLKKIRAVLENYTPGDDELAHPGGIKAFANYIYVFTPDGHLKKLKLGATVLDFAFEIHTEIGQHCTGAKVNKLFVPLKYVLKTGDRIEIITSKNQKPNHDWLNWVTTSKAIIKIRRILKDAEFSQAEAGKDMLLRKLGQLKVDYTDEVGNKLVNYFKSESAMDMFHGLAEGKFDILKVKEALQPVAKVEEAKPAPKPFTRVEPDQRKGSLVKPVVIINDDTPMADVKFAKCCQPVSGDEIFGFVTVSEGIKIHRTNCTNAVQMKGHYGYRVLKARWAQQSELSSYIATIHISGADRTGILNDIAMAITGEMEADIRSINLNSHTGKFDGTIMVNVDSKAHLMLILAKLSKLKGIRKVARVN